MFIENVSWILDNL